MVTKFPVTEEKGSVRINRKQYHIDAVKAKVKEPILGWDFIKKHRLDFIWSEFGDVFLQDRRNKISAPLVYTSIPQDLLTRFKKPRNRSSSSSASETTLFEVNSAKLFPVPEMEVSHPQCYLDLVNKFPEILKPKFKTEDSEVTHFIDTKDELPCKAKMRPLPAGSKKATLGKKSLG